MKKLALLLVCGVAGMTLGADEYTIQTISALKESSITPAFEKKVEKSALGSKQTKEGLCNIVTVGRYGTPKEAKADLKKAQAIAKDSFVRPVTRLTPKVCETVSKEIAVKADTNATIAPLAVKETVQPSVQENNATAGLECPPAVQTESVSQTTVVVYDRNLARKSDISEAIEYYKNSPYHSFRPVGLPR